MSWLSRSRLGMSGLGRDLDTHRGRTMNKIEPNSYTAVAAALAVIAVAVAATGHPWLAPIWGIIALVALHTGSPRLFQVRRFGLVHRYTVGYLHGGRHRLR